MQIQQDGYLCSGSNLGAHVNWERNYKHCERIKAERWCQHCHKPLLEGKGWIVNVKDGCDFYPISVSIQSNEFNGHKFLGDECIKQFINKNQLEEYAIKC